MGGPTALVVVAKKWKAWLLRKELMQSIICLKALLKCTYYPFKTHFVIAFILTVCPGYFLVPVHIQSFYFIAKKYPLWGNGVSFDVRSLALPRLIMQCTLLSFSLPHRPCKSGVYPDCKFFTLNTYQPISISSILWSDCRDCKVGRDAAMDRRRKDRQTWRLQ